MKPFIHPAFKNKLSYFDPSFEPKMKLFGDKAMELGIIIWVNSTFRNDLKHIQGAVVVPAKKSNHFVAEAIDANLKCEEKFWTSEMLKTPAGKVLELINYAKSIGLRWGGDFTEVDSVHFDSGLNIRDPKKWDEQYKKYHK